MANLDTTAMSAALKEYYHGQKVIDMTFKKNPFMAMVKKDTKAGGKVIPVPIQYGSSQGSSADFATAQANQTAALLAEFMLTRKSDYSIATITNEMIEATKGDAMAFINASTLHIDAAYKRIVLSAASALYRSGTGSIGQIATGGITGGAVTFADATQALQFERGMALKASSADGSGTVRGGTGYVLSVDRSAGTMNVSATRDNATGDLPTGWAAGDFLCVQGNYNAMMSGLGAWLPIVRPTIGSSFYGVDRGQDPDRLAGVYHDGSSDPIEEALVDIASKCAERGGSPGKIFTSYASYRALVKALGAKVQYQDLESDAGVGFRGIVIHGNDNELVVLPDRNCPGNLAYALDMDTWCLRSVGEVPHIVTYGKEGLEILRVSNSDAAEVRIAYYANLECNAPGFNGVCKLAA